MYSRFDSDITSSSSSNDAGTDYDIFDDFYYEIIYVIVNGQIK